MSEKPKFKAPRSIPEINNEYQQLCLQAGHIQYQVFCHEKDLVILNDQLRDLNLEGAAAQQAAKEAEKVAAEKAASQVPTSSEGNTTSETPAQVAETPKPAAKRKLKSV